MATEKRKIPKGDRALRSLYMSPTYMKNLKGKKKDITWESEKTPSGSGDTYTYRQGGKAVAGSKKREIRTKHGDTVKKEISKHMSFPNKEGGKDTYRREIKGDYDSIKGPGYIRENIKYTGAGNYVEKQNKKGKVLSKTQIKESKANDEGLKKTTAELRNRKYVAPKKKKTVKQKTTTYQGKKGDTIEPKVKKSTTGMVAPKKYKELYKKKSKKWLADKAKRKTDNTVEKQAKRETDSTVQKQIKSGFGDMLTPSSMKANSDATKKRMKANSDATKAKMKANREATLAKMKANREATLKRMKANK
jgi:hypothetical protein